MKLVARRAAHSRAAWATSGWLPYLLALLGGSVSTAIGLWLGQRLLLPVLQVLAGYPVMAALLGGGRRARAIVAMLVWAAAISLTVIAWVLLSSQASDDAILFGERGNRYRSGADVALIDLPDSGGRLRLLLNYFAYRRRVPHSDEELR